MSWLEDVHSNAASDEDIFLHTAFISLARWFVKTNTLPLFLIRLHIFHAWWFPSIFNASGNTKDDSSVTIMEFMVRSPLCEWSTTHRQSCRSRLSSGMLPLPVHILTLKRFARNAFFSQNWCTHVTFWSISTFRHSYQHARKTQSSFLFLCIYLFIFVPLIFKYHLLLCHVLNRATGTVGGLHLFPVWSWWGCCGFGQSSSRKQSCESAWRRLPLLTHKNCLMQQTRPTHGVHSAIFVSFRHPYFQWWYLEVRFLLWNNL